MICPSCNAGELLRIEKHHRECDHCRATFWRERRRTIQPIPVSRRPVERCSRCGQEHAAIEACVERATPAPVPWWVQIPIYLLLAGALIMLAVLSKP